ncbi:MAG: SIR2 family protein [Bacteroidota bacterium]
MNWDLTIDTIQNGKCILFLGPELFTNAQGERLEARLLSYLNIVKDEQVRIYEDGLFFFKDPTRHTLIAYKIRQFFEQEQLSEAQTLFEQIAHIPFHFIISITPDHLLERAFEAQNFKYQADFYKKKQVNTKGNALPSAQKPLLYNMFGSIHHPESLLLDHNNLFDYLESVFEGNKLSNTLRDHILSDTQSIIFLGVPFERWYMQLIMRILQLNGNKKFLRFADSQNVSERIQVFGKDEFLINFIPNDIPEFVQEIYQRCASKGILRTQAASKTSFVESLLTKFKNGNIDAIFEPFEDWLDEMGERATNLINDLAVLSNRHRRHQRKIDKGMLNFENATVETNAISDALLRLLQQAKKLE